MFIFIVFIENRPSGDNNPSVIGTSNPNIIQPHYSSLMSLDKPSSSSSSDISHIWNPINSLNSSFSSTSSTSDYEPMSSLYGSEARNNSNLTTTNDLSVIYNPNHEIIKLEESGGKRESIPQFNGATPLKKRPRNDELSALPTPPPSSGYSSVTMKMMVRNFILSGSQKFNY
jgi:hypothetical protein